MNTTSEVTQDALAKRLAAAEKRIAELEATLRVAVAAALAGEKDE